MNPWIYRGETFDADTTRFWGFVYLITNTLTGKQYIGKKFFTKAGTKQVKGRKKKIRKDSDWMTYHGSSAAVLEDIKKHGYQVFTREILHLCKSKAECTYWESYEIFNRHALLDTLYYNDWISCRVRKAHLTNLHF